MLLRLGHDDIAEVVEGAHQPDAADDEALIAARDPAAAGIGGVVVDRVDDVVDSEAVTQEFGRVEIEPELPGEAAEIVDLRDAGNLLQRRLDDPALILRQLHQVLGVGFERVTVDLPLRRRHGVEPGGGPGRQGDVADAFPDALALPSSPRRRRETED